MGRKYIGLVVNKIKQENPCTDCKDFFPYYVMEFDHGPDPSDKIDDISNLMRTKGLPRVLAEIAKCELVCSNCHKIRTWNNAVIQFK